ncbi:NUDIX domain-containing protein [Candidatus Dojkabacteria bacterium]|nr:NUDIX domain-containing protein [Candidatus Dojkabacteria bacterium]
MPRKEYFDVLDDLGNKTGERALREEVHQKGLWHRAIHAWLINNKGELLLQKRGPGKDTYPNHWTASIGGHIDAGDDSLPTVIRETEEELGLHIREKDIEFLFTVKNPYKDPFTGAHDREFNDVYLIRKNVVLEEINFDKEEVSNIRFMHFLDFEKAIIDKSIPLTPQWEEFKKLIGYLKGRVFSAKDKPT